MALGKIKPTGRCISVTFPVELFDKLNADAAKNGLSFSRMVNMACRRYYGRIKSPPLRYPNNGEDQ